jgi:2-keto-4-pentenoate hydratase
VSGNQFDETSVHAAADSLQQAEHSRSPMPKLSERHGGMSAADAYAVQAEIVRRRLVQGACVVGYKIGLTSAAMRRMMRVDTPDYGHLLDDMFVLEPVPIQAGTLVQPRVEPELAFVLGDDLPARRITVADVWRATAFVMPCLEIIDSRYTGWQITFVDTVADNASSARVVLGGVPRQPAELAELAGLGVVLRVNGLIVETGALGAVMGNPANAVAWLASELAAHGVTLRAGDVVLSGSPTRAVDVRAGDHIEAAVENIGTVTARFA